MREWQKVAQMRTGAQAIDQEKRRACARRPQRYGIQTFLKNFLSFAPLPMEIRTPPEYDQLKTQTRCAAIAFP